MMESTETIPIKKNKSKHHLFNCFKPDDKPPRRKEKTSDPLLSYIALAEKQGIVLPSILSSALTAAKCGGAGDASPSRRRKMGKQRSLRIRQALIAALNHTSLGKKIINRTKINKNKNNWGKSRVAAKIEGDNKISNTDHKQVAAEGTNSYTNPSSDSSSAFTSSTLSSSTDLTSSQGSHVWGSSSELNLNPPMNGVVVRQEVGESRKRSYGLNMGLCWHFFTSLLVFILLGKLYTLMSEKMM